MAFPTIIALTPQVREPMWEFHQPLSISIPIMYCGTREMTLVQVISHCGKDLS